MQLKRGNVKKKKWKYLKDWKFIDRFYYPKCRNSQHYWHFAFYWVERSLIQVSPYRPSMCVVRCGFNDLKYSEARDNTMYTLRYVDRSMQDKCRG